MDRTNFAGLTELVPGDALESDGGSFLWYNPKVTDHFLEVGAVTHRHDAHVALANPSARPAIAVVGSGGTIGNDVTLYVGYTVTDAYGGETLISPLGSATTGGSTGAASAAPTVTSDTSAGSLAVGTYYYAVTLLDGGGGETTLSDYGQATRAPGFASGQMVVSGLGGLMAAAGAVGWRLYRSFNGGGWAYLAAGATATFTDDGSLCADSTITPPDADGTGGANAVTVTLPSAASGTTVNVYASESQDFTSPSLVVSVPRVTVASAMTIRSLAFNTGAPPPVSTAKAGASKIDALTDIVNLGSAVTAAGFASGGTGGGSSTPTKIDGSSLLAAGFTASHFNYWKDNDGAVHLEGVIFKNDGTAIGFSDALLTLPAGYRPTTSTRYHKVLTGDIATINSGGDVGGSVQISTGGLVLFRSGTTTTGEPFVSFDGMVFQP